MKVLIINSLYAPLISGGAEKSVQILANLLSDVFGEVRVLSLRPKATESLPTLMEFDGDVRVDRVMLPNIYWPFDRSKHGVAAKLVWHLIDSFNLYSAFELHKYYLKHSPDLTITNNLRGFSVATWVVAKIHKSKIIHISRDYYLLSVNASLSISNRSLVEQLKLKLTLLFNYHKRLTSKLVDGHIAISDFMLKTHRNFNYFQNSKSVVIFNSLDRDSLYSERAFGDRIVFGYLGGQFEYKGWKHLYRIFSILPIGGHKLVAAGHFSESISNGKKSLGSIEIAGYSDVNLYFESIDVLLVPSDWDEPFGRVVIEALSYNVPVICSSRGGLKELSDIFDSVNTVEFSTINSPTELIPFIQKVSHEDFVKLQQFSPSIYKEKVCHFVREICRS